MPEKWEEMATVGRIARAHGNRGQVIVNPETDFPYLRFQAGAELYIERGDRVEALTLRTVRFQHDRPVLELAGIDTMDAAEALAGQELRVPVDRLAPLPAGTYYRHDLVGCRVETRAGETVGVVREVEGTLGGSRLVVDRADRRDGAVLVPLALAICTTIDVNAKRIVIEPPEGLLELNG